MIILVNFSSDPFLEFGELGLDNFLAVVIDLKSGLTFIVVFEGISIDS